jgi:hypothetical protein
VVIGYIFPRFGIYVKKNLATLISSVNQTNDFSKNKPSDFVKLTEKVLLEGTKQIEIIIHV